MLGEPVVVIDLNILKNLVRLDVGWSISYFYLSSIVLLLSREDIVSEVGDEAHAIVQLHHQGLLVEHVPVTIEGGALVLGKVAVVAGSWTLKRLHLILVKNFHFPDFLVWDHPLVVIRNNLHLVRMRMAAHLFYFIQIDFFCYLRRIHSPNRAYVVPFIFVTFNGLVGCGEWETNQYC